MFFGLILAVLLAAVSGYYFFPRPQKKLQGNALITGAGSGIGRMMALECAKEGCTVVLWDINKEGLASTKKEVESIGTGAVYTYHVDVSERESVYRTADLVKADVGKIDLLINNAGVVRGDYIWDLKDEHIEKVFKVNTFAPMWITKAFIRDMMDQNSGHIVTISSASAFIGVPKLADYAASKWAVFGFAESLRLELRQKGLTGVKTTIVCPFYINTGMFDGVTSGSKIFEILDPVVVVATLMHAIQTN
eukprot:TRINITY_DN27545_c0_g1_i1.p1 TRINITY_DN27545_c0_g1~~TRINITY_DN27545_c0_g1_i1.p1  ORF type:complete len:249 (+),score=3.94 TRINITY_DN27545_c0_g1_i1:224-970(+)